MFETEVTKVQFASKFVWPPHLMIDDCFSQNGFFRKQKGLFAPTGYILNKKLQRRTRKEKKEDKKEDSVKMLQLSSSSSLY